MEKNIASKVIGALLVLTVALLAVWYVVVVREINGDTPTNGSVAFAQTGELVRDRSGLEPGEWYLMYGDAETSTEFAQLQFIDESTCIAGEKIIDCDPGIFSQETRATLEGIQDDGVVEVETLTLHYEHSLVRLFSPQPFDHVSSPLTVTGEAVGGWYFEADFPVRILDANEQELGLGIAQAQEDWMTENFVPFEAIVSFTEPTTETGFLVLERDNPSGLPENADEFVVPVSFVPLGKGGDENGDTDVNEQTVQLFYYNPELDMDSEGNILCSSQGLVSVERSIPVSMTPVQDTIRLLISGDLSSEEQAEGVVTEFPLEGFALEGANLADGVLTLEFFDPLNQTVGGSCRVGVLWAQIKATAEQFGEVNEVRFIPEDLFQP